MNNVTTEIERKFIFSPNPDKIIPVDRMCLIEQHYLIMGEKEVRVRFMGGDAFITFKTTEPGIKRTEYEMEIPFFHGRNLIKLFSVSSIEKVRTFTTFEGHTWELDVYNGLNEGLYIAEVELENENEELVLPPWVGEEVTDDKRYRNSYLSEHPYTRW